MSTKLILQKAYYHLIGFLAIVISTTLSSSLLARGLGARDFGILSLGLFIFKIFIVIGELGLEQTNNYFLSKYLTLKNMPLFLQRVLLVKLFMSFILMVLFYFSSTVISKIYDFPELGIILKYFAIAFLFYSVYQFVISVYQSIRDMKFVMYNNIFLSLLLLIPPILAIITANVITVSKGFAVSYLLTAGVILFFFLRTVSFHNKPVNTGNVLEYSLAAYTNNLIVLLLWETSSLILGLFASPEQVGYFNIGKTFFPITMIVSYSITTTLFPTISKMYIIENNKLKEIFRKTSKYIVHSTLPFGVLTILLSAPLIFILYGEEYVSAIPVLITAIILSIFLGCINQPLGSLRLGTNNVKVSLKSNLFIGLINVPLSFFLCQKYGALGVTVSLLISHIIGRGAAGIKILQITGFKFPFKNLLKGLIISIISSLPCILIIVTNFSPIIKIVVVSIMFMTIYFLLLIKTGEITSREINFAINYLTKKH